MVRFRFGSIPVDVHFSHLAISGLFAYLAVTKSTGAGWPGEILANAQHPRFALTFGVCLAMWMAIISISVLVHELGHALVSRAFGYRPSIQLVGLGGVTNPNANETIPWHRDVLLTLAGPLSGLSLGLISGAAGLAIGARGPATYLLYCLFFANLVWAVLNLLPVTTLDGGRISTALMVRAFGRRGFLFSQVLSLAVGAAVVAFAVVTADVLLAFIFAMPMLRAIAFIGAYWNGQLPADGPTHPYELAFLQAQAKYGEGKLDQAGALLKAISEHDLQPQLRARVHDLAGWIAVKLGNGTQALDQFSRVEGLVVAPQALGAAHSLKGDDSTALPFWEQAARESNDPTVVHEWAGALVRAGHVDQARAQPGVKMALAHAAAARTWFVREDYLHAAEASEASFREEPNFERAYDAGCAFALAGRPDDALRMLEQAGQGGQLRADKAQWDPELVTLQKDPRFIAWLGRLRTRRPS